PSAWQTSSSPARRTSGAVGSLARPAAGPCGHSTGRPPPLPAPPARSGGSGQARGPGAPRRPQCAGASAGDAPHIARDTAPHADPVRAHRPWGDGAPPPARSLVSPASPSRVIALVLTVWRSLVSRGP